MPKKTTAKKTTATSSSFIFVGDPRDPKDQVESITLFGYTFPKGEAVEVKEAEAIKKLRGNSHFVGA